MLAASNDVSAGIVDEALMLADSQARPYHSAAAARVLGSGDENAALSELKAV